MSDMKCPFCQQEMAIDENIKEVYGNSQPFYYCKNKNCKVYYGIADIDIWQELITTRKALDLAVDALKATNGYLYGDYVNTKWDLHEIIRKALEQIESITKGGNDE